MKISKTQLTAWRTLITAHSLMVDTINRQMLADGCIPLNWYDVLIELHEATDSRLRMHELADQVVLSRSGLTRLVDRLEQEGLLARQPDPDDRRGYYVSITDAGREALRKAWGSYERGIQTYFAAHLNDGDAETLAAAFARMIEHLRSAQS